MVKRSYSDSVKQEVIELFKYGGLTVNQISENKNIPYDTIYGWIHKQNIKHIVSKSGTKIVFDDRNAQRIYRCADCGVGFPTSVSYAQHRSAKHRKNLKISKLAKESEQKRITDPLDTFESSIRSLLHDYTSIKAECIRLRMLNERWAKLAGQLTNDINSLIPKEVK